MPAAAPIIGAVGAVAGGALGAKGAKDAAGVQAQAADAAAEESRRQFDLTRGDTAPYRDVGQSALYRLSGLFGLPTQAPVAPSRDSYYYDPGRTETKYGADILNVFGNRNPSDPLGVLGGTGERLGLAKSKSVPTGERNAFNQEAYDRDMADYERRLAVFNAQNQGAIQGTATQQNAVAPLTSSQVMPDGLRIPGMPSFDPSASPEDVLYNLPGYQFRLNEAIKSITRNSARYRFTPRAAQEMGRYVSDYSSSEYNKYLDRATSERNTGLESLFRLSGLGGNAVNTSASAGMTSANQVGNALTQGASGQANAAIAGASSMNNAIQGGLSNYMTLSAYNNMNRPATPTTTTPSVPFYGVGNSPY